MGLSLVIAEPTGLSRRFLRRFTFSGRSSPCPGSAGGHDALALIGDIPESEAGAAGDNWPRDDPRWPSICDAACAYRFAPDDEWQRNDIPIYRRPDGTEVLNWGPWSREVPPGTMIRIPWYDRLAPDRGEAWQVWLPDGGTWITTQAASGGGYWQVIGTPPLITVSPSIFHNAPHGWHGFIRNGELVPA